MARIKKSRRRIDEIRRSNLFLIRTGKPPLSGVVSFRASISGEVGGSVSSIVIIIYKGLSKTAVTRINLSAPWSFIDFLPTTPRAYVYGIEAATFNPDLYCEACKACCETLGVGGWFEGGFAFIGNTFERIEILSFSCCEEMEFGREFFFFSCSIKRGRVCTEIFGLNSLDNGLDLMEKFCNIIIEDVTKSC